MKLHLPLLLRKALLLACILPSYSNTLWDPYYKIDNNLPVEADKLTKNYNVGSIELKNGIALESCTINFSGQVKGDVSTVKDSQLLVNQVPDQNPSVSLNGAELCYTTVAAPEISLTFDTLTLRKDETDKITYYRLSGDSMTLFVNKLLDGGIIEANQQVSVNGALGQLEVKNAVFKTPTLILKDIITLAGVAIQGPEETAGTNNMVTFEGVRSASGVLVKNMSVTINHGPRIANDPYEPCFSGEIIFENVGKFKTDNACGEQFFKDVRGYITNYGLVSLGGFRSKEDGVLLSFGNEGFTFDGKRSTSAIVIGYDSAYIGNGFNGVDENEGYKYLMYAKGPLTLCHNDHISISYNEMVNPSENQRAAAIFVDNGTLFIYDNYKVIFESNIVYPEQIEQEMVYTPLVPYAIQSVGNNNIYLITRNYNFLSSIEFYQPINIKGFLHLNGGLIDANQKKIVGGGEILFSGTKADAYLAAQLGLNVDALKLDPERIQARLDARTSNVNGAVTLYSGTLKVTEGALVKMENFVMKDGSSLVLSTSSNISADPVITVNQDFTIEPNTKLTLEDADNVKVSQLRPLMHVEKEVHDAYSNSLNFYTVYHEKGGTSTTLSDIISWSSWNGDKQGFSYVDKETGWERDNGELVWIDRTLYLRHEECGAWFSCKTMSSAAMPLFDSDKNGAENYSVDELNGSCWVHTANNMLASFFSKYGVLFNDYSGKPIDEASLKRMYNQLADAYYPRINPCNPDQGEGGFVYEILYSVINGVPVKMTDLSEGVVPFARKEKSWAEKYNTGVRRSNDVHTIESLTSQLKVLFGENGIAPVALSYKSPEFVHVLTCWGYEEYSLQNSDEKYLVLYVTDSDSEPHNGRKYSEMWAKEDGGKLRIMQENGLSQSDSFVEIFEISALTYEGSTLPAALKEYVYGAKKLIFSAESEVWGDSTIKPVMPSPFAATEEALLETGQNAWNAGSAWKKSVGDGLWANAYLYDDSEGDIGDAYYAFALSQTSFEFVDEVDGDVLSTSEKYVKLAGDLEVKDVYVKGHQFTFGGTGTLDSTGLEISGSLALSDGVQIVGTPIKVVGGSLNAQVAGQTTIKGGGITLTDHGVLHGAAFRYADGKFALSNTSLSENLIFSDGSGILSATVDFGGNKVAYSTLAGLNEDAELNTLFYNTVNGWGGVHQFLYSYEAQNAEVEGKASSLNSQVALKGSSLSLSGSSNAAIAIGSYFSSAQETSSVIALSEQAGGTVNAAGVNLTTVADESSYFSTASQVSGRELTIVRGSSLTNDGNVRGNGMQIVVETGAQLGGSGQFAGTQVQAGGSLMVGNSPGAPVYEVLTLNSGAILQFCLDGSEAASATAHGWGSGTHSVLTVTGDLVLAEGVDVQVGCSLDFLNAVALGETQTLTLIQLSETASADLLETLQSGTEFLWADGDAFKALTEVGAGIRDVSWSAGSGNTLQLSFTVSSCPEGALRWTNAGGDGVWDAVTQNWQDSSGTGTTFAAGKSVLFYDGGTVRLQGELNPETVVVSTPRR